MAFSLGTGTGGAKKVGMGDLRRVEYQAKTPTITPTTTVRYMSGLNEGEVIPVSQPIYTVNIPDRNVYGYGMSMLDGSTRLPGQTSYDIPYPAQTQVAVQQPASVSTVPGMPEGYGYANGFPFRGSQPPGWNIGNASVPGWAMDSTGFNWADRNAYNDSAAVKFSQQGKDKGLDFATLLDKKGQQTTYNPYVVYNQDVFDKYRAGSSTWNPIYRDWFGSGMYNTELRTQEDFNWLANQYGIGIHDVRVPKYAGTDSGGAEQAAWLQNALITDWMRKYGKDTSDANVQEIIKYLTQSRPTSTPTPASSAPKQRYYYGGGWGGGDYGGGWGGGDYGGSSYTPSWFNGLLSWRI